MEKELNKYIRNKCSSLKHHLFLKNIVDSPLCTCGSVESTQQFFLECPLYNQIRPFFLQALTDIGGANIHTMLNGNSNFSNEINTKKFDEVHKYITKSKRSD